MPGKSRLGVNPFAARRGETKARDGRASRRTLSVSLEVGEMVADAAAFEGRRVVGLVEDLLRDGVRRMAAEHGETFEYPKRSRPRR